MNKSIYFALSYQNRNLSLPLLEAIKLVLHDRWILRTPVFDFTDVDASNHKLIMEKSFELLRESNILVAEASEKNIGVGIEVGFAKALNKPIAYLQKADAQTSTTVAGTADIHIMYTSPEDAATQLVKWLNQY